MARERKCPPDCTCHRHRKCSDGCACNRHKGVFCAPGCTCERHSMRKCDLDCTCGKHSEELTYGGKHYRVRKVRGNAAGHVCVGCSGQAREWAQIHDTDGTDPLTHYQPMCSGCHKRYDDIAERAAAKNRGRGHSPQRKAQQSERMKLWNASLTPEQRSENTRKAWQTRRTTTKVGD